MIPAVLVVEDDYDIREGLCEAIEAEGFQTYAAGNGVEALEMLDKIPRPCLVILDLMMPKLDGQSFLDLHERRPDREELPIVVMSASSDSSALAGRPGVVEVMNKPFELPVLLRFLKTFSGGT